MCQLHQRFFRTVCRTVLLLVEDADAVLRSAVTLTTRFGVVMHTRRTSSRFDPLGLAPDVTCLVLPLLNRRLWNESDDDNDGGAGITPDEWLT
jgi:hypothetical protein